MNFDDRYSGVEQLNTAICCDYPPLGGFQITVMINRTHELDEIHIDPRFIDLICMPIDYRLKVGVLRKYVDNITTYRFDSELNNLAILFVNVSALPLNCKTLLMFTVSS